MSEGETAYMHFCNGCGKFYADDNPGPAAVYDTQDEEIGVLEFCSEACLNQWQANRPALH
jgi:hypothetical protein